MTTSTKAIEEFANQDYKYGFVTDVDADEIPKGLNEDVIRLISEKKDEPEWLLEWLSCVAFSVLQFPVVMYDVSG